jgi:hypothetical protein
MGINLLALYLPLIVAPRWPNDPLEFVFYPCWYPAIIGYHVGGIILGLGILTGFWSTVVICSRRLGRSEFDPRYMIVPAVLAFYSFKHAELSHELAQNLGHS